MLEKTNNAVIEQAVRLLKKGELVAFPTETVYGLGAAAANASAVRKIFAAKQRPANHPVIVHLADQSQLSNWAAEINASAKILADHFWPGPLTLIMPRATAVIDEITGGQNTVGIRIPAHPVAQLLLREFDDGIAAPSANRFGHVSPTQAIHVQQELGDNVALIIDGGDCPVGIESTIIDVSSDIPRLLRPGMITISQINTVLGKSILLEPDTIHKTRAPGMLEFHYAPRTSMKLLSKNNLAILLDDLTGTSKHIALMTYSNLRPNQKNVDAFPMPNNANAYAHDLYAKLRWLDMQNYDLILVEQPPDHDDWRGITDRLLKASAKNSEKL